VGGVGFSELLLLALIALFVVGPRRLPEVARTLGTWSGRARQAWASLKSEFDAELDRDHNRRILEAEQAGEATGAGPKDERTDEQRPGAE